MNGAVATEHGQDWIYVLGQACRSRSQASVATMIGYSPAVVSQVLKGAYKGDISAVQMAVEGALMGVSVECPVIGDIPRHKCLEHQRRGARMVATNPLRIQLAKTCPSCPQRRDSWGGGKHE